MSCGIQTENHVAGAVCQVFHRTIEVIGRRWTGAIISALMKRPRRFCEFREAVPDLSDRLLTERLKELEEWGIIVREVSATRPIQVLYRLTPKGEALDPVFCAIGAWARQFEAHDPDCGQTPALP
ncbi:MAG TPA: helix-turn-helix domain-containing protein [Pantanalinema sp.]